MTTQSHELIPREHTQQLLDRCAQAASRIKPGDAHTLADRLEAQVDRFADRTFLVCQGQRYSYLELEARANQYAHIFMQRGLKAGDVCALMMENRPDFFFCWFGLCKLGVVVAFINHHARGRALLHALHSTGAKAVVTGEECLQALAESPEVNDWPCWLVEDDAQPASAELRQHADASFHAQVQQAATSRIERATRSHLTAEDTLLLIFTSGTTGQPKGIRRPLEPASTRGQPDQASLGLLVGLMGFGADTVYLSPAPLYHAAPLRYCLATLALGGALIVMPRFDAAQALALIERWRVTHSQWVPTMFSRLLQLPRKYVGNVGQRARQPVYRD